MSQTERGELLTKAAVCETERRIDALEMSKSIQPKSLPTARQIFLADLNLKVFFFFKKSKEMQKKPKQKTTKNPTTLLYNHCN